MEDDLPGIALVQEFLGVHEMLRSDLRRCNALAQKAAMNLPHDQIMSEWRALRSGGFLWELRDNCIRHCSLLHRHHVGEDDVLFPELRRTDRDLSQIMNRLEAEHRKISVLIDQVIRLAESLPGNHSEPTAGALVSGLRQLQDELLKHLAAEEKALIPALMRWREWPQP